MNLLYYVLLMSITGGLVFALFKVVEQVTKHHFSATWHYNVLKCISLFFLLPFGKIITIPINNRFSEIEASQGIGIISDYAGKVNKLTSAHGMEVSIALGIWLVGIAGILLSQLVCFIKFRYIVYCNRVPANAMHQWVAKSCAAKMGIKKKVHLYVNENITTPMLIGFFSPIILLPSDDLDLTNSEYIISHELTHYKQKDMIFKIITLIIRTMHWFNPLAYLMIANLDKWCEYACDERNAINLTLDNKKKYGMAILDSAAIMPIYGSNFGTPFLLPKQNLKERLVFMLNVKKMSKKAVAFAGILTVIFVFGGIVTALAGEVGYLELKKMKELVVLEPMTADVSYDNPELSPSDAEILEKVNQMY